MHQGFRANPKPHCRHTVSRSRRLIPKAADKVSEADDHALDGEESIAALNPHGGLPNVPERDPITGGIIAKHKPARHVRPAAYDLSLGGVQKAANPWEQALQRKKAAKQTRQVAFGRKVPHAGHRIEPPQVLFSPPRTAPS